MLDKSIPYAEIWMYRERELPVVEKTLPEGFRFELYQEGDELEWAAIETAVAEFDDETKAMDYFNEKFAPYLKELKQRMLFVTILRVKKWELAPLGGRKRLMEVVIRWSTGSL